MTEDEPIVIRTKEGLEVTIGPDGEVVFSNLQSSDVPDDILDIIHALNPDAAVHCDVAESAPPTLEDE